MAKSIKELLQSRNFAEPPEIKLIKKYIRDQFKSEAQITITDSQIIIGVNNSALAGSLQPYLHQLKKKLGTNKRLVLRIV